MLRHPGFLLILWMNIAFAQQVKIQVDELQGSYAVLSSLRGEIVTYEDSIPGENNAFQFNLDKYHPGFYRLSFENKRIDFIYDNEDIEIRTNAKNVSDSLKVVRSESNKIYNQFISLNKEYKTKSELLHLVLARYPRDDDYYKTTSEKLLQVQEEYLHFINITSQQDPNSFIARYVRSAQLPAAESEDPLNYLKSHALDMVSFDDDELIYSDAFTSKTIEYLSYYRNPQLPQELLEKEFISAVDSILIRAKVNDIVYKHVVEYLLDGFKKFGFDNVLSYITENYVIKDDLCLDVTLEKALDRRIQQVKTFKQGIEVPNIILPDPGGTLVDISKIDADRLLIIFYASWCPHCKSLLPEIYKHYKSQSPKKLEVIAVSLDSSRSDWLSFINSNQPDWFNVSDLKGWDGQASLDYYIYATPSMFLVDKNMKLISMPKNLEEIQGSR